jgi:ribosomal protein L21
LYDPIDSTKYAILDLGGVRQVVEEGQAYTCTKRLLQQLAPGPSVTFHNVMAVRQNGKFLWGKPYVTDAAVEAELIEEFCGPTPLLTVSVDNGSTPEPTVMAKYKITKIRHS